MFFGVLPYFGVFSQNTIKGVVIANNSKKPLVNVLVKIQNATTFSKTGFDGAFILKTKITSSIILSLSLEGYETQNFPISFTKKSIDLGTIFFYKKIIEEKDSSIITLSDDELDEDTTSSDNISGLLQASKDAFLKTAAFEFSASFFRIKGLDSENAKVLINGVEMNKIYNGRPQWSNWGGLNDVLRNQVFSNGLAPSNYTFGGVLGATNMNTRASDYRVGGSISYASSNRSYVHRMMASYATGLLKDGWAFTASASRRSGNEGFNDATFYSANSFFLSAEKQLNTSHSLNFTAIIASNKRGKSSPNTQEVFDLKNTTYNEYWGFIKNKKVNSRVKKIIEPILMLNHYWTINSKTSVQTAFSYQFGKVANSRLDYTFGTNPSGAYYQKLPSYELRRGSFDNAYEAEQRFRENGQIDWQRIFDANATNTIGGDSAAYVLYDDRNDDKQLSINTIFTSEINENSSLTGKIEYKKLHSENYAKLTNLLGGTDYLDIDRYGDTTEQQQNNLLQPNRKVVVGDRFKYNFNLTSSRIGGFVQAEFQYNRIDFFIAGSLSNTAHQREGLYQNGGFKDNSLGTSEKISFTNFGFKGGGTYKITSRHLIDVNTGFISKAPTIRNTFSNSRENNNIVSDLVSENIFSTDVSYILRIPKITSKITGYYASITDATEISFFFADGLSGVIGNDNAFVQEILTGINKKHFGIEFGLEVQITPTLKLKTAGNIGQYTYNNNPKLTLTSDSFDAINYTANLKNYKLAAGPQKAYSVGFEYRNPDYWWFGSTVNYMNDIFIDIAPLTRTQNFYLDTDGLPFNDYNATIAKQLLQQEQFDNYVIVNFVGGKSWRVKGYYIGVFASVSNLLNTEFKTGGFEQGRNANYRTLRDDKANPKPVFGSKYWYGRGTNYFLNLSVRF